VDIIDWIKKNPSLPTTVRDEVEHMYAEAHVAVCRDLANASKRSPSTGALSQSGGISWAVSGSMWFSFVDGVNVRV
jgi:hypothetical protein